MLLTAYNRDILYATNLNIMFANIYTDNLQEMIYKYYYNNAIFIKNRYPEIAKYEYRVENLEINFKPHKFYINFYAIVYVIIMGVLAAVLMVYLDYV